MAYKSRHEYIDEMMPEHFEKEGFWGEQVEEKAFAENYTDKRIDVINFKSGITD